MHGKRSWDSFDCAIICIRRTGQPLFWDDAKLKGNVTFCSKTKNVDLEKYLRKNLPVFEKNLSQNNAVP